MMISLVLSGLLALAQAAPQGFGPNSNFPTNLVRDTATARQFAKTVTGPRDILKNWTGAHSVCEWEGFYCEVNPDTNLLSLASIDFSEFELTGDVKLTGFLEKFPDLAIFHARSNHFKGSVPNIRSQKYLFELDLANNDLSGEFPGNVFEANLTFLDLRFNQFSGKIPAKLFTTYPAIEFIALNNNQFSGELPPTIGASPVKYLVLANNKLTGAIPAGLANAPKLQEILLLGNQLTGSIPKGLGAIPTLELFDASDNKLTGPVPEDLCASKSITSIVLTKNNLDKKLGPKCQEAKAKGILKL